MTGRLSDIVAHIDNVRQLGAVVVAMRGIAASHAQQSRGLLTAIESYSAIVARTTGEALRGAPPGCATGAAGRAGGEGGVCGEGPRWAPRSGSSPPLGSGCSSGTSSSAPGTSRRPGLHIRWAGSAWCSCPTGGHRLWFLVEAADADTALGQLPHYLAERTEAIRVAKVKIP